LSSASAKSGISTFLQLLPWHLLPKRLFGYLLIWEFSFLILLLCIVTTRVLFRLLTTRFFMISELSTLRSIIILLVIISSMAPLLCLLFLLPCRLQPNYSQLDSRLVKDMNNASYLCLRECHALLCSIG
jgi:hypothetical protein